MKERLGLDRNKLVVLGLLLGCDYLPKGVPQVGKEKACEMMTQLGDVDALQRFESWTEKSVTVDSTRKRRYILSWYLINKLHSIIFMINIDVIFIIQMIQYQSIILRGLAYFYVENLPFWMLYPNYHKIYPKYTYCIPGIAKTIDIDK